LEIPLLTIAAYLAGSVNFSIILFKILGKEDPRSQFSGNPGATNVYRQAGLIWAIVVLLLDMGRAIAVAIAAIAFLAPQYVPFSGLALILGNRFPCFHGFQGGKGVANYLGFTAAITPTAAGLAALAWGLVYAIARKPFLSSFAMVFVLAAGTMHAYRFEPWAVTGIVATALLIYVSHKQNVIEWIQSKRDDRRPDSS
jgi:glycerol-3-phosphate acyltransferase PlsY